MGLKLDILQDVCNLAIRQVQDLYPALQLMFIPHEDGRFSEVVALSEHEFFKHPAGKIAHGILEKNNGRELSSFLGMAIHKEAKWLGLASTESILALFNINTDEFENPKDARRAIYHLVWHALDLVEIRSRPEYASKFRSGPMIPKRSPMNMARLNLQADVFAAVMSGLQGEDDALDTLARQRAADSIAPIYARRAEDYPFVIALEAAKYAYQELMLIKPVRTKYMGYARQLATEVGKAFDDKSIRNWWGFSEPAQDMAWRNMAKNMILGCAVFTSEDAFVRAAGHLVSEITGVTPLHGTKLGDTYNAYANQEQNQLLHREMVEKAFEEAIARGVREESGQPLIAAANEQNEGLADGNILGWCGNALQAAGRAFESALSSGMSPLQAARLEFEGTKDSTTWDTLKKLGETIIDQKRKGFGVTLGSVADICNNNPNFAPVLGSIKVTMKDASYIQKLQAANDFSHGLGGPAPATLALSGPVPSAAPKVQPAAIPAYSAPAFAAAPGLGMGSGGSNAARLAVMEKLRQEQMKKSGEDDRAK